jgi:hypothetical protein
MLNLKFEINRPGDVMLKITDVAGFERDEIRPGYLNAGEHLVAWKPRYNMFGDVLNYMVLVDKEIICEELFVVKDMRS